MRWEWGSRRLRSESTAAYFLRDAFFFAVFFLVTFLETAFFLTAFLGADFFTLLPLAAFFLAAFFTDLADLVADFFVDFFADFFVGFFAALAGFFFFPTLGVDFFLLAEAPKAVDQPSAYFSFVPILSIVIVIPVFLFRFLWPEAGRSICKPNRVFPGPSSV